MSVETKPGKRAAIADRKAPELAERWPPYRSLAVSYLFASEHEGGT